LALSSIDIQTPNQDQKNTMRTIILIALLGAAAIGATFPILAGKETKPARPNESTVTATSRTERGKYLVTFGGCNDCHTPFKMGPKGLKPDFTRLLSGHPEDAKLPPPPKLDNSPWFAATAGMTAWTGPWGISYAANLTPDQNTGLGIWTEEMFIKAMRTGKHMGESREILPPMPWQNVGQTTDEDLKALYAYLRSIPAIKNRVPEPVAPNGQNHYE
jgi:mono/diheme cytochrome c family protein